MLRTIDGYSHPFWFGSFTGWGLAGSRLPPRENTDGVGAPHHCSRAEYRLLKGGGGWTGLGFLNSGSHSWRSPRDGLHRSTITLVPAFTFLAINRQPFRPWSSWLIRSHPAFSNRLEMVPKKRQERTRERGKRRKEEEREECNEFPTSAALTKHIYVACAAVALYRVFHEGTLITLSILLLKKTRRYRRQRCKLTLPTAWTPNQDHHPGGGEGMIGGHDLLESRIVTRTTVRRKWHGEWSSVRREPVLRRL